MFREVQTERLADEAAEAEHKPEHWLRCAVCHAPVVPANAGISVNGAHEHTFMNPGGLRCVVRCFSSAPGSVPEGPRSTVWTWFPGFAWRAAMCGRCGAHLGWSFHSAKGTAVAPFFALLREALA
ncbi:cereblon family protein [Labilithrix luteola]|uniref:cereblon family protein n=1 Tax=Labilithrix luteola TaxID=1391654 RepID=UPI0011BAAD27|nr:cereblon family protein [Labilithrix luteola]